mgnify:CR=1 FL=1
MKGLAGFLLFTCLTLNACDIQSNYKILESVALKGEKAVWIQTIYSENQKMSDAVKTTLFGELQKQQIPLSDKTGVLQVKIMAWIDHFYYYDSEDVLKSDESSKFVIEIYKNSKLVMTIDDGKAGKSSWKYHCEKVIPRMITALKKATE